MKYFVTCSTKEESSKFLLYFLPPTVRYYKTKKVVYVSSILNYWEFSKAAYKIGFNIKYNNFQGFFTKTEFEESNINTQNKIIFDDNCNLSIENYYLCIVANTL